MADTNTGAGGSGGSSGSSSSGSSSTRDDRRDDRHDDRYDRGGRGNGRRGATDEGMGVARNLLKRFRGRAEDALAELADENKDLRVERRELRDKLARFDKPGVVVLEGDEAKAHAEYKALGAPADLKKKLDELPGLQSKVAEADTRTAASKAAGLVGWNPDALAAAAIDKKLTLSFVDTQKDGKTVQVPHVKPIGSDDKTPAVALADWFGRDENKYLLPALTAKSNASTSATGGTGGTAATGGAGARGGTQMVEQSGGSGTAQNANNNGGGGGRPGIPGRSAYKSPGMRNTGTANKP